MIQAQTLVLNKTYLTETISEGVQEKPSLVVFYLVKSYGVQSLYSGLPVRSFLRWKVRVNHLITVFYEESHYTVRFTTEIYIIK